MAPVRCVIVACGAGKIEAVSTASVFRKVGVALRIVREQARRNRTLSAILVAVTTTLRSFGHAMHLLWLEVTGTVFLAMAAFGAMALIREYVKFEAGRTTAGRVAIAVCFTLTFTWFGLTSFWRVRRKSQRP